ncbi:retrovirus-related Pol polyprotein from type-1 retrotransposable element R2 [Caerostris darwini]|uniref:Retrovirus-related Pol polyprotein from type-1 retrotransposable element R2 n=1 Tax=Caerostris darwini TaxID=1538125 RepID=A0AAV4QWE7_9ARAC|nr:retrovirus-related Pol polyprotein from type-1 retrotransposable element R2 [Caerostris darwini]
MSSNVFSAIEVLDSFEASLTMSFTHGEALDNFEFAMDSSFSPICHRTRSQLANRELTNVECDISRAPVYTVSGTIGDASKNFLLEQDVSDTVCEILNNISPPVKAHTFYQVEVSENSFSHQRPPCDSLSPCLDPVGKVSQQSASPTEPVPASAGDEVILIPSDFEVSDLFSNTGKSPKFDIVRLICRQCKRRFFSAGGLENHLYAVHDIHLDSSSDIPPRCDLVSDRTTPSEELTSHCTNTGPPSCAPFSKIVPAITWATVAAKPAITSSQPWAGQRLGSQSTPPRTGLSKPSQVSGVISKSAIPATQLPEVKARKKINFNKKPDEVSHAVLLPMRPSPKKARKTFPCLHCDFKFRTVKSRDEHLVVHVLEEEFNRLHGITSNSHAADFDDFVLPKPTASKRVQKQPKSLVPIDQATTSSSRQVHPSSSASPSIVCEYCDQAGFPSRKALKYHLFRLYGQPMRKASQHQASSSSPQAQSATPPAETAHLASSVQRLDAQISMSFPIQGKIVCPERGCEASFVSKHWTSMKGSLLRHLRFVYRISIATCHFQCDICQTSFSGKPKEDSCFASEVHPIIIDVQQELQCPQCEASFSSALGLQNHSKTHLRQTALSQITPLHIPASRRRKRSKRKKRASSSPQSDTAQDCVTEVSQLLAPPVADVPFVEAAPQPSEHDDEPLFHFSQIFEDILTCDPSHDCAQMLSDAYCQLVTVASSIAFSFCIVF